MAKQDDVAVDVFAKEEEVDFKDATQERALEILECTAAGLTAAEAAARLQRYGPNALPTESRNPVLVYLSYAWNPLSWAMEAAAIIAIALLDYADFALIMALLIINCTISFVEESSADKAIKALASALAPKAKALRDGALVTVAAVDLVPGDIVMIRLGDIVPADVKILSEGEGHGEETPLTVDQAALTGESLPVKRSTGGVAFAGSAIKQGERHCLVYATGASTFFGRAAALLGGEPNVANLQRVMSRIGAICLCTIGLWCVIELGVQFGAYGHACSGGVGGCPTLLNMLVIVVGGIPIAMPTVLSVTLALGAYQLAKHGAIVSRMSAVEELAGLNILCSDKTGTLTLNKLTVDVGNVRPGGGFTIADVLKLGALSANIANEEPIDMVMFESYAGRDTLASEYSRLRDVPFNPTDKFTACTLRDEATKKTFRLMKGAPQVVVRHCWNAKEIETESTATIEEYASRGFRGLGLARAEGDGSDGKTRWELVGLLPLFDPPRHDTRATIEECLTMGIHVKMITGDQLLIGKETARQLGMGTQMYTTEELAKARGGFGLVEGHASVEELVEAADGFAEVFPEHKHLIVKILQERGHVVGMTGDGVNDAPALKKADVGIAVDGATDAARGAADIVLTQPGLYAIVAAVIGARKIFQRMTTYARYTVASTFRICFTFGLLTVIYDWYFPTILIVVMAVFNDGAMIALSKDRVTPSRVPNRWNLSSIFISGAVYGLYLTLSSWVFYYLIAKTDFFASSLGWVSLEDDEDVLQEWCIDSPHGLQQAGITDGAALNTTSPITDVTVYASQNLTSFYYTTGRGSQAVENVVTALAQCVAEQKYIRGAMLRAALYLQVSVSGQALVFVVRCVSHSFMNRAAGLTYAAFLIAQFLATIISVFGFNGYDSPPGPLKDCVFCTMSDGSDNPFYSANEVPVAGTEAAFTASVIGSLYYAGAAWIWAAIWYVGLDPIKWMLMAALDEEGVRRRPFLESAFARRGEVVGAAGLFSPARVSSTGRASMSRASVQLGGPAGGGVPGLGGRVSVTPAMLARASMVTVRPTTQ